MKLRSLAVNQFKKFTRPIRVDGIGDGLNVLVGPNEMGKSTLLDALRAALFEKYNSKAHTITALQNDRNQAGPVVELAFELDDGLYRITKRFIKKTYAHLLCPDGRTLEGDAAEDTLRRLLGFEEPGKTGAKPETLGMWNVLWVQQGQSFGAPEIPGSARSSLHSALEAEVGTVLGGRRGRALPQVIEEQLEMLMTKFDKPRGTYKDLIDRVESLRDELKSLHARRQDLSQTFEELEIVQESFARLSVAERDQADQRELDEARKRHTRLAELEALINGASTELALRKNKLAQSEKELGDRQRLQSEIKNEEATLEKSKIRRAEAMEQEKDARSRLESLRAKVRDAESAVEKADETVSRSQRVMVLVDRDARIRELKGRSEKAKDAEERLSKAQQSASAIQITDTSIDAIRRAAKELETVTSQLRAAATLISFDIDPDREAGIKINERLLAPDQPSVHAVEPTTIFIPERGRITIEPAIKDRDKLLQKNRAAMEKLREALLEIGAVNPEEAEELFSQRQRLLQDAELARQEAELYAPETDDYGAGAQALFDHIQGLTANLNHEKNELGLDELPARAEAETALIDAQEKARKLRDSFQSARAALTGPQETLERLKEEQATANASYEETDKRLKKIQRQLENVVAECSTEALENAIEKAHNAVAEQEENLLRLESQRTDETLPQLEARIGRLEQTIQDRRNKRADLQAKISGLKSRVEAAEGAGLDEMIEQQSRDLELCEEEKRRLEREVKVLKLLLSTLRNAEQKAKERYLSPILRRVRPYLQLLFPGSDILIDENLRITGVVREASYEEAFDHLSMGTQEQVAVLIRLAFAEMMVEQGHPATVILDDALVFSDDRRMKRMFDILNMAAQKVQVLVLTCREQLFEELGGRSLSLVAGSSEDLQSA